MGKVAIIGATGNVGAFAAHAISEIPYVRKILLYGRKGRENLLSGLTNDLNDSFAASGNSMDIGWTTEIEDLKGFDIVVITAGNARVPGQDRLDLALGNTKIIAPLVQDIAAVSPSIKIFMVTNPVDVMTAVALRYSGLPPEQVFGLGTHLDSMRLKSLIAEYFKVHVSEVHTRIIGEHGMSMVPLWSATTIGGIQICNLPAFSSLPVDDIMKFVRDSGERIIKNKGSTVYGPGEAIAFLVRTILGEQNRILTVTAYIKREVHGIGDVCIGVPARINKNGVYPLTIKIDPEEITLFRTSVDKIKSITSEVFNEYEKFLKLQE